MLTKLLPVRLLLAMSAFVLIIGTIVAACKRTGITLPPSQAHFMDLNSAVYFITDTIVTDTIPVGVTTVANKDRTVSFTVSSPSGALAGTQPADQYTLSSATVTIPAGQALGYIVVKGNFAFYKKDSTRKDTLVFAIVNGQSGGIVPADFNDSFTLVLRGHCLEGLDFDPAEFNGIYNNCIDSQGGSPTSSSYQVQISSELSTGATSARLVIQNFGAGDSFGAGSSTDTGIISIGATHPSPDRNLAFPNLILGTRPFSWAIIDSGRYGHFLFLSSNLCSQLRCGLRRSRLWGLYYQHSEVTARWPHIPSDGRRSAVLFQYLRQFILQIGAP